MEPPRLTSQSYVRLTAITLWENLPLVLLGGGVFAVLCLPTGLMVYFSLLLPAIPVAALTVVPAWAALLAMEVGIAEARSTRIGVMLRALPRLWMRGSILGLLLAFPLLVGLLTLPLLSEPHVSTVAWLGFAADAFGLLLLSALSLYAFPLLVLEDVSVTQALRAALFLAGKHISNTLGLLGMGALCALAIIYVSSGLVLILPAVWGLFIVNNCLMVLHEERAVYSQSRS